MMATQCHPLANGDKSSTATFVYHPRGESAAPYAQLRGKTIHQGPDISPHPCASSCLRLQSYTCQFLVGNWAKPQLTTVAPRSNYISPPSSYQLILFDFGQLNYCGRFDHRSTTRFVTKLLGSWCASNYLAAKTLDGTSKDGFRT